MGRLFNVVGLIVVLGCEVATREATPIAVLAAAPAGETKAEKAARRAEREAAKAAKAAKAGGAEKAGKAKGEKKVEEQPEQPVKPAKPVKAARVKPTASDVTLPACPQDNALTYRSFGAGFLRTWCGRAGGRELRPAGALQAAGQAGVRAGGARGAQVRGRAVVGVADAAGGGGAGGRPAAARAVDRVRVARSVAGHQAA
jgi:hypothetical protein